MSRVMLMNDDDDDDGYVASEVSRCGCKQIVHYETTM